MSDPAYAERKDTYTYADYKAWELKPADTARPPVLPGLEISLESVFSA
jgi:hypothetical protein